MCRYAGTNYKQHYACFACRKMFRQAARHEMARPLPRAAERIAPCPQCGTPMKNMGLDFKAPKQTDIKQWQKVRILYANGHAFHSCGCGGPGPRPATLREVRPFLIEQEHLKMKQDRKTVVWQRAAELRQKREKSAKSRLARRLADTKSSSQAKNQACEMPG